jgi:PAS domain S-box-containing protein
MAEVPSEEAFAGVEALRSTVLRVAGVLALVLLVGAWFLVRASRLRQIAEATVRSAEIRTRGILDAASDGFVAMGDDGRVTGWNAAAAELFGWSSQEAIGQRLSELIMPPEQREAHAQGLQRFLRTGEARIVNQRVEVEAVDRDGKRFPVELAVTAAQADESWTFNAFVHDISERKRHESELAEARDQALEASRLKSDFLANMSHEIRTPMNGVIGMTSLLLDTDLDPAQRDGAETVLRSGESLLAIINDILDFSKIEAGRLDLETIEFGTQNLIEDVTGLQSVRAVEKGIELVAYVHPDVPAFVKGDPGRVRQILTNLLGNAIKFTDSGEVVVEVSVEAQHPAPATASAERTLRFEVIDTGIGIGIDQQTTIFESFTQADSSTTRRYGGTGLGLAISQQLVTLMSGEIGVQSAVGTGSTFWFTLPATIADSPEQRPRRNDLGGTRVLVVDDNATNRVMLGRTLESWGVEHQDAPDAPSALRALRDGAAGGLPFDAALLDLHMPGVDGLTLASQITADPSIASVALVLLTSSAQRGEASLAEAAGMAGYLAKPVHPVQLHACLATVLATGAGAAARVPIVTRHRLAERAIRGGTVLLAEDNPVNQRVACGILQALGYRVEVVSDGREAVAAAALASFDAILMDCQMPEMDGYEATRLIRAAEGTARRTPIVAVTASAMQQDRQRCLDAGMDDHLAKPLRRDQLAVILERFAHGGQPARDANGDQRMDNAPAPVGDLQTSIRSRLDELFEGLDGDIEADCAELLQSFLRRAADEIDLVTDALAANDAELVRQRAHSLKGMAANVGVTTVAMLAAEVEDAARDGHLHAIGPADGDLRVALEAATRNIHAMLPSLARA